MVIINVEDCLSAPCHSISSTLEVSLQFTEIIWLLTLYLSFSLMGIALELIDHLRAMGETNALLQRNTVRSAIVKAFVFIHISLNDINFLVRYY